jgi:signal transduction histidine kinase
VHWWLKHSLRTRLTLLGVGVLTVGLAVTAVIVVLALGVTLQRSVDAEATRTGEDVARLVEAGQLPHPLPVAGEQRVQVVNEQHQVLAASDGIDRLTPFLRREEVAEVRAGERLAVGGDRIGVSGQVRVSGVPAGDATVLVAKPLADLRQSWLAARNILVVGFPVLVAVLALVTWRVVGATLRPVEALRAGAAAITATGQGRHGQPASLPVPESHDEIHRLAVTLNDMLDRLAAARARQRAFVADAAHELRSPLTNMRTELEVAQHLGERTDWPQVAADLLIDTQRLARLVDDLLLLARVDDARPSERAVEPVELGGLLRAIAERYPDSAASERSSEASDAVGGSASERSSAEKPLRLASVAEGSDAVGIAVSVTEDPPVWTEGAPEALRRVVTNLVDNAVRHARTRVVLAAVPEGRHALITVTDDGPGIPAADRERVFDRFTRLDNARARDAGGAGLGLAIVRELVRRHGGTVQLADAEPGLSVEVRLPAAAPA